jgi:8-oxo-dGTP pyrophosphatase MutT (NUDIX family)
MIHTCISLRQEYRQRPFSRVENVADARPALGEEINAGPVTIPRVAATVIVLREVGDRLEVLLARRTPKARFMGGAWVFPGGAVSPEDGEGEAGLRAAGLRELQEEAGIVLRSPADLAPFSRWITPAEVTIRYDTWFFLAAMPDGQQPRVDGEEVVDARWFTPAAALEASRGGEILLVFPTIKHLEQLSMFASLDELMRHARAHTVQPVQPRVVGQGETARIVLPGEPGYEG